MHIVLPFDRKEGKQDGKGKGMGMERVKVCCRYAVTNTSLSKESWSGDTKRYNNNLENFFWHLFPNKHFLREKKRMARMTLFHLTRFLPSKIWLVFKLYYYYYFL